MAQPATGTASTFALGLEREFQVPGLTGLTAYRLVPPIDADLERKEEASPALDPLGMILPGVPGAITGSFKVKLPFRAAHLLEPLFALLPSCIKATPEAGVRSYTFEPDSAAPLQTFWALVAQDPVLRYYLHGVTLSGLAWKPGDNKPIEAELEGASSHGTDLSVAVADPGNTGTYTLGPLIRGPLADPAAGPVHFKVTRVVGGLQFKVEQTGGVPTFPGAAVDVALDGVTLEAVWQDVQGDDGADLGIVGENMDPLQLQWPGAAADHADLAVGDIFVFQPAGSWTTPSITLAAAAPQMTSAHWRIRVRRKGEVVWIEKRFTDGEISLSQPVDLERGNGSRYAYAASRVERIEPTVKLKRSLFDDLFRSLNTASERLEVEILWQGALIGASNTRREGLVMSLPSARIDSRKAPIGSDKQVEEDLTLIGETDDEGATSVTIVVTSTRDWTVPA